MMPQQYQQQERKHSPAQHKSRIFSNDPSLLFLNLYIIYILLHLIINKYLYHHLITSFFQAQQHMTIIILTTIILLVSVSECTSSSSVIYFSYLDSNGIINKVTVYENSTTAYQFVDTVNQFSCANGFIFTYNQTDFQFQENLPYNLTFANFTNNVSISIGTLYHVISPKLSTNSCLENTTCQIKVQNNCQADSDSDEVYVNVQVDNSNATLLVHFVYNVICDIDKIESPIQWGKVTLAVLSVFLIFGSSHFQGAKSFKNSAHYINEWSIGIYNLFILISSVLVIVNLAGTTQTISYICLMLSVLMCLMGFVVCCSQFFYWLNIKCFKYSCCGVRVMDFIGLNLGVCVVIMWFVLSQNWILGDIMYTFIFIATIKLVKFGSLKIAIITFAITMTVDIFFIVMAWAINKVYYNNAILSIFNNPLFLVVPTISHYPNRKCSWFFIASMLFPGMLQCYFQRFDSSRSSKIYTIIFFNCYVITMIIWIIINIYADFTFPYDLLVTPATLITVVLFANRRGQINQIWLGQFYDEVHKNANNKENELKQMVKKQKSPSQMSYNRDMFQGLKVDDPNDSVSIYSRGSNLTEVQVWKLDLKPEQQLQEIIPKKNQRIIKQNLLVEEKKDGNHP